MLRGCIDCGATFEGEDDTETVNLLNYHLLKCSEDGLFLNDDDAIYYDEVV